MTLNPSRLISWGFFIELNNNPEFVLENLKCDDICYLYVTKR